jgi:rare lipoprotein A
MRTGTHKQRQIARSAASRSLQAVAVSALLGLMPLAASSAAVPDGAGAPASVDAAAATAMIELVPVPVSDEVTLDIVDQSDAPAPSAPQATVLGRGSASYYAAKFDGRRTASGERFDNDAMTAAHRTLPFGSKVRVTNPANGRSVVVRINDRGPFTRGRMIDVSRAAAEELGLVARGHATVELALIDG